MATVKAKYLGDLRLECTHLQSGTKIICRCIRDNLCTTQQMSTHCK